LRHGQEDSETSETQENVGVVFGWLSSGTARGPDESAVHTEVELPWRRHKSNVTPKHSKGLGAEHGEEVWIAEHFRLGKVGDVMGQD